MINIIMSRPQDDTVLQDFTIESKGQMSQEELAAVIAAAISVKFKVLEESYTP